MMQLQQPILAWGNGLGLRITMPLAKAAHLTRGTVISMEVIEDGIVIRPVDRPRKLSLAQKLKAFDPKRHGGEVMAGGRIGAEVF